jgi:hypothetical protein
MALDTKLERIRELINLKEQVDTELDQLVAGVDTPKRGRPRKTEQTNGLQNTSGSLQTTEPGGPPQA